jgi:dolichyl-phosphate beta-glucosyltransferase
MRRNSGGTIDGDAAQVSTTAVSPIRRIADHDLTLVIPAYNEESRLPWTLCELGRFLADWGIDYRVLVADDGSSDKTPDLTNLLGPQFSTARLDRHRGKGAAVRNAMLQATGRVVAFTDADLPFELSSIREGYERIRNDGCDVVFGARDLQQSAHHARRRFSRTAATWIFREVVKRCVSREVTDTQCGLKLFSLRAAGDVFSRVTIEGFAFDAEVVFLTERLGLNFCRLPVNLVHEYSSTLSLRRDTWPMLRDIANLWWRNRKMQALPAAQWPASETAQELEKRQAA